MAQSFLEYLQAEGLIAPEDVVRITARADEEAQSREAVDAGILTEEEASDALFYYRMSIFVEENTVSLNNNRLEDVFFAEYLSIVAKGFVDFLKIHVTHDTMEYTNSLTEELIIYQPLIGSGTNRLLVGLAAPAGVLMELAAVLHKRLIDGLDIPAFEKTKEDMIDFYFELINNINSSCSYKFNIDFDLEMPRYQESANLQAALIYTADYSVEEQTIKVFMVKDDDNTIWKAGL
jgi:hypothetical protein